MVCVNSGHPKQQHLAVQVHLRQLRKLLTTSMPDYDFTFRSLWSQGRASPLARIRVVKCVHAFAFAAYPPDALATTLLIAQRFYHRRAR